MSDLLLHRVRDRPPTPAEAARDIRALYRERGGVLAGSTRYDELTGRRYFCAFVVAFCDPDDRYAANFMDGGQSEREWHQRDHVLTGFAMTELEPDSHWEALAAAKRGELQRHQLCVWFDRGGWPDFKPHFRIFRRAPRIAPTYRPAGPELAPRELRDIPPSPPPRVLSHATSFRRFREPMHDTPSPSRARS